MTAYFPSVKTRVLSALEIFKRISKKYTVHGYYTGHSDGIRELENAEEEVRKLKQQGKELANFKECHAEEVRGDKRTEPLQSASKVQILQAFLVPQGTSTSTIVQHYMTLTMLCRTDFCGIVKTFKNILQARKVLEDEKPKAFTINMELRGRIIISVLCIFLLFGLGI